MAMRTGIFVTMYFVYAASATAAADWTYLWDPSGRLAYAVERTYLRADLISLAEDPNARTVVVDQTDENGRPVRNNLTLFIQDDTQREILYRFAKTHTPAIIRYRQNGWVNAPVRLGLPRSLFSSDLDKYILDLSPLTPTPPGRSAVQDADWHSPLSPPTRSVQGTVTAVRERSFWRQSIMSVLSEGQLMRLSITDPQVYEFAEQALRSATTLRIQYLETRESVRRVRWAVKLEKLQD
jgi:hypothetical protein